jgi:hypothetical protein
MTTVALQRQRDAVACLQDEGDTEALRAVVRTLDLFIRFEEPIRAELRRLLDLERAKLDEAMKDPAVQEVMREFACARVEIRDPA